MEQVRLPDLETIKRFSIAVRRERADAADVIEALETDLAALRRALGRPSREQVARTPDEPPARPPRPAPQPARRSAAPTRASRSTAARKTGSAKRSSTKAAKKKGRR